MSAPWDNQPTPSADEYVFDRDSGEHDHIGVVVSDDTARAIERRMRHAEALLADVTPSLVKCGRHDLAKAIRATPRRREGNGRCEMTDTATIAAAIRRKAARAQLEADYADERDTPRRYKPCRECEDGYVYTITFNFLKAERCQRCGGTGEVLRA